jgi:hypothetical protein
VAERLRAVASSVNKAAISENAALRKDLLSNDSMGG